MSDPNHSDLSSHFHGLNMSAQPFVPSVRAPAFQPVGNYNQMYGGGGQYHLGGKYSCVYARIEPHPSCKVLNTIIYYYTGSNRLSCYLVVLPFSLCGVQGDYKDSHRNLYEIPSLPGPFVADLLGVPICMHYL